MSIINVTFDTKEKTMSASIDGKSVENLKGAEFYPSWDDDEEFRCCLTTMSKDEESELSTMTRICASQTLEAKASRATESVNFPGFVEIDAGQAGKTHKDILQYFEQK